MQASVELALVLCVRSNQHLVRLRVIFANSCGSTQAPRPWIEESLRDTMRPSNGRGCGSQSQGDGESSSNNTDWHKTTHANLQDKLPSERMCQAGFERYNLHTKRPQTGEGMTLQMAKTKDRLAIRVWSIANTVHVYLF